MKFVTRFVFLFVSYDMLKMNFECTIFSPLKIFCKAKKKMCKQMISSQGLCMYIVRPQQKDGSLITSIPSTKRYVKYLMFPFSPWHFFPFFQHIMRKKIRIGFVLKSTDVRTQVSISSSENSFHTYPHTSNTYLLMA